jgi:hypothetical protein
MKKNMYFHFCHYWQRWSLVLLDDCGRFVELDMEPGRHDVSNRAAWALIDEGRVRVHSTPRYPERGDIDSDTLPDQVVRRMCFWLEPERVAKLMNGEVLRELTESPDHAIRLIKEAALLRWDPLQLGEVRQLTGQV